MIVPGSTSQEFAAALAAELDRHLGAAVAEVHPPVRPVADDLQGVVALAEAVRDAHGGGGGETDHFRKHRVSDTDVEVRPSDARTAGRDVVLVDDIVATGATMSTAIEQLSRPARVFVACVHPMLADGARTKLAAAGADGVYGTDTVERPVSAVSAAPAVADVL